MEQVPASRNSLGHMCSFIATYHLGIMMCMIRTDGLHFAPDYLVDDES